jgi:hypothetical protein
MPDPEEGGHSAPTEPTPTPIERSATDFTETRNSKGLDSFDVQPPVGIPQSEPGPDGVATLGLPEDYAD